MAEVKSTPRKRVCVIAILGWQGKKSRLLLECGHETTRYPYCGSTDPSMVPMHVVCRECPPESED